MILRGTIWRLLETTWRPSPKYQRCYMQLFWYPGWQNCWTQVLRCWVVTVYPKWPDYIALYTHYTAFVKQTVLGHLVFYKSGKVISDQFKPLNMFSFWGNSENGCRRCHSLLVVPRDSFSKYIIEIKQCSENRIKRWCSENNSWSWSVCMLASLQIHKSENLISANLWGKPWPMYFWDTFFLHLFATHFFYNFFKQFKQHKP